MSGANVFVGGVGRAMEEDLGAEIPDVEAEHLSAPHRLVAARGREDPARLPQPHAARFRDAAREVRVFAVKLDRRVEAADGLERIAPDGEVSAVEHGAEAEHVLREHVRQRREAVVVHADEHAARRCPSRRNGTDR